MVWKTIKQHDVVRDTWMHLRCDTCEVGERVVIDKYYVIVARDWVNITPLTPCGKILVLEEYRHGIGRTAIGLPGGLVDDTDPSTEHAAMRELTEETGIASCMHLAKTGSMMVNPSTHTNLGHSYLALFSDSVLPQLKAESSDARLLVLDYCEFVKSVVSGACVTSGFDTASILRSAFYLLGHAALSGLPIANQVRSLLATY